MLQALGKQIHVIWSQIVTLFLVFMHLFKKKDTVEYPDVMPYMFPRWRGRIILSRDPDGQERCVACNLCAVACPVDCIALQKTEDDDGRWYPEFFRINFSRCIFCGLCEEACPTDAVVLTRIYEFSFDRRGSHIIDKETLLRIGDRKEAEIQADRQLDSRYR